MTQPDFSTKCEILAELWIVFRDDSDFTRFINVNDVGLPLAYAQVNNLASNVNEAIINQTWENLLEHCGIFDDEASLNNLQDIIDYMEA